MLFGLLALKGQVVNLTSGHPRSRSQIYLSNGNKNSNSLVWVWRSEAVLNIKTPSNSPNWGVRCAGYSESAAMSVTITQRTVVSYDFPSSIHFHHPIYSQLVNPSQRKVTAWSWAWIRSQTRKPSEGAKGDCFISQPTEVCRGQSGGSLVPTGPESRHWPRRLRRQSAPGSTIRAPWRMIMSSEMKLIVRGVGDLSQKGVAISWV